VKVRSRERTCLEGWERASEKKLLSQAEIRPPEVPMASTAWKERKEEGRKLEAFWGLVCPSLVSWSARIVGRAERMSAETSTHFTASLRPLTFHEQTVKEKKVLGRLLIGNERTHLGIKQKGATLD
jgi:hypothetical protein